MVNTKGPILFFENQARLNGEVVINGSENISRDFTSVIDVCDAIDLAINTENINAFGKTIDIGCGEPSSLSKMIDLLEKKLNKKIKRKIIDYRDGDILTSCADTFDARNILGFKAKRNLDFMIDDFLMGKR